MRSTKPNLQQLTNYALATILFLGATASNGFAQMNNSYNFQTRRAVFQGQPESNMPVPGLSYSGPLDQAAATSSKLSQAAPRQRPLPHRSRFQPTPRQSQTLAPIITAEPVQASYNVQNDHPTSRLLTSSDTRFNNSIASPLLVEPVNSDNSSWIETGSSQLPAAEAQFPETYASGYPRRHFFGIDENDTCDEWAGFCECDSCNDDCADCGCGSKHAHALRKFLRLDNDCRRNSCRSCKLGHRSSCGSSACQAGDNCTTCDVKPEPKKDTFMAELKRLFR